jgi:hypothetical protein
MKMSHGILRCAVSYLLFQFVSQLSQHLLPEQVWGVIKDFLGGVKDSLPTQELRELIGAVEAYVSKVCMHISESSLCLWLGYCF